MLAEDGILPEALGKTENGEPRLASRISGGVALVAAAVAQDAGAVRGDWQAARVEWGGVGMGWGAVLRQLDHFGGPCGMGMPVGVGAVG